MINQLRVRKGQAWAAFWSMSKIWKSDEITLSLKLRIYDTMCLSVLLYSSYRYMLNRHWTDWSSRLPTI